MPKPGKPDTPDPADAHRQRPVTNREWRVSSNRSNTFAALATVIGFCRPRGYLFVDLLGRS